MLSRAKNGIAVLLNHSTDQSSNTIKNVREIMGFARHRY